eukprot:CAMPEP_0113545104 /NCGR_PEP_ID=MMETSP0015_2-20120614/11077_1 /TAXON_ID=2838 /ORGANISM="Odontella" /LENGTH=489 /DNA_ID=CAMNT_0000445435 /DNA_START=322 /DNA_END=1791 /DNA_ORIENTATION=- /assembly_acc=CAM_ASM_000160
MATTALTVPVASEPQSPSPSAETERLEAAHTLLGVSPVSSSDGAPSSSSSLPVGILQPQHNGAMSLTMPPSPSTPIPIGRPRSGSYDASLVSLAGNKSQSSGGALDALAALASSAAHDDSAMPPPPPRPGGGCGGRMRSASNPEGMEKWDSLGGGGGRGQRQHFMLPSSILEEELAGANAACAVSEGAAADAVLSDSHTASSSYYSSSSRGLPLKKRMQQQYRQPHRTNDIDSFGTSPNSVMMAIEEEPAEEQLDAERCGENGIEPPMSLPEEDESDLEPAELLRRARARLLEDLSTEGAMGEKGVLPLPHSLAKYKQVYNKNGRIGIYTPAERAAIIAKFNSKRSRRVWNKKIRYNCRKNLADRRMRVKGRFVKRSTEQAAQLKAQLEQQAEAANNKISGENISVPEPRAHGGAASTDDHTSPSSSASSSRASSPNPAEQPQTYGASLNVGGGRDVKDEEMPDVEDPEAGFHPKDGQPYRRTRRHTIT